MEIKELSKICRLQRNKLALTQKQLARDLNISKPRISEFENGKSNMQADTLLALLERLEINISA